MTEEEKTAALADAITDLSEALQCRRVGPTHDWVVAAQSKLMRIMTSIQSRYDGPVQ